METLERIFIAVDGALLPLRQAREGVLILKSTGVTAVYVM